MQVALSAAPHKAESYPRSLPCNTDTKQYPIL